MTENRFPGRDAREGKIETERHSGFDPILVQTPPELVALYVGILLLNDISASGGTVVSPQNLSAMKQRIEDAIPADLHGVLEHERDVIIEWLEDRLPDEEVNPDVSHIRASGDSRWKTIVQYASDGGFDLRGEYYDPETETWPIVYGTPLFFDEASAVIERTDGTFVTLLFRDTRWLMPVKARKKPKLADVLTFPPREEE